MPVFTIVIVLGQHIVTTANKVSITQSCVQTIYLNQEFRIL